MKKILPILSAAVIAGGAGFVYLFYPEQVSQDLLTKDFEDHRQAYSTIADFLVTNKKSAEITGFMSVDENYGIINATGDFNSAVEEIMAEDHDVIKSDGRTVEFVYHSTGGKLKKLYGSVIFTGDGKVYGKETVPLGDEGWELYIKKD